MSVLSEAEALINGDRQAAYDDALPNHERIAAIWSVILGIEVTPEQAVLCMAGLKLARLAHDPTHRDSQVDGAGYLGLLEKLSQQREARRAADAHPGQAHSSPHMGR